MLNSPKKTKEWKTLEKISNDIKDSSISSFFDSNPNRFNDFSVGINGLFFDYSKQKITTDVLKGLIKLAHSSKIEDKRKAMFEGKKINITEDRAVLHTALRRPKNDTVLVDGKDIMPDIYRTLDKMKSLSEQIRNGDYKGSTGKSITHIVSIGIGGSDFGPHLVANALTHDTPSGPTVIFVSNIDAHDIMHALNQCQAETTLFIIISKSFKTQDTLLNAQTAKNWLTSNLPKDSDISKHFIAVSENKPTAIDFGITENNYFPMWKWVNGRFSLWSAVGLPICVKFGFNVFRDLLDGAYAMDQHFLSTPLNKNIPVLMALIGIWNRNFLKIQTLAILPYSQKLFYLPAYLRQLDMESNGKTVNLNGETITDYQTGPVIFGESGTNGQHSFYQLLHQGSDPIASDFIGIIKSKHKLTHHHNLLLSHMLAQSQALMQGKQPIKNLHRYFSGSKPNSTILIDQLDAFHLGMLLSLYEHKIFIQGVIWDINSFDQFGVELGKELSQKIENNDLEKADSSTRGLFSLIHKINK